MAVPHPLRASFSAAAIFVCASSCVFEYPVHTSADALTVDAFRQRLIAYDELRDQAEDAIGDLDDEVKAATLVRQEHVLADEIRRLRPDVVRGHIFTPDAEVLLTRLLRRVTRGPDGAENVAAIRDEWPATINLQVNREYPDAKPLSRVPADVLRALPKLPKGIQYRFVPRHLVLYDTRADLIIDFMPVSLSGGS